METAIATGNALFLLYDFWPGDVGGGVSGAKREERRSLDPVQPVRTG